VAQVMEFTGGRGADVVYDCIAGSLTEKLAQIVKVRGHLITYGFLDFSLAPFPWWSVAIRSIQFHLYKVFDYTGNRNLGLSGDAEAFQRARHFIATGLRDGSLPPVPIDRAFNGVERVPEAMSYMLSNQAAGKIVVTIP
jgi:NADPH:quinone reductase-like Zn-dependent oxidoreductase